MLMIDRKASCTAVAWGSTSSQPVGVGNTAGSVKPSGLGHEHQSIWTLSVFRSMAAVLWLQATSRERQWEAEQQLPMAETGDWRVVGGEQGAVREPVCWKGRTLRGLHARALSDNQGFNASRSFIVIMQRRDAPRDSAVAPFVPQNTSHGADPSESFGASWSCQSLLHSERFHFHMLMNVFSWMPKVMNTKKS